MEEDPSSRLVPPLVSRQDPWFLRTSTVALRASLHASLHVPDHVLPRRSPTWNTNRRVGVGCFSDRTRDRPERISNRKGQNSRFIRRRTWRKPRGSSHDPNGAEVQVDHGQGPDCTMTIQDSAALDGITFLDKEMSVVDQVTIRISYLKGREMLCKHCLWHR